MKKLLAITTILLSFTVFAEGDAKAGLGETNGCGSSDPCGTCVVDAKINAEAPPIAPPEKPEVAGDKEQVTQ